MTRLLELLISLLIAAVLFVLVGLVLPSSRSLVEKVETNRRQTIVFDTINSFRRFSEWNPIALRDPRMKMDLQGPAEGVGARLEYSSNVKSVGKGSWEIVASEPRTRVDYALTDDRRGSNKRTSLVLRPTGRGGRNIEITQTYDVDYGWDLLGRYAGLYVSRTVGDDMQLGLRRLSNMLASVPNIDYAMEGTTTTNLRTAQLPAENLLLVPAGGVERNTEAIRKSMDSNVEWINRTIAENDLVAAGPMRIITAELGRETYTFDVAIPVRTKSAADEDGEDADDADKAEGEDEAKAAAPAVAVDEGELEGLKLLGPVEYVRTEPLHVAIADHTGYMAELENVRNALRAWAMTQGHDVTGRPFEIYKKGVADSFTENGEFEVYWTLRD